MGKIFLFINTIKYLKVQQIYFRLLRKVKKPKITDIYVNQIPKRQECWHHVILHQEKIDANFNSYFLNNPKLLNFPTDWNNKNCSKIWTYNLHYFEDLLAKNAENKRDFHISLLGRWVDENPLGVGNGWEPYPISIRIVNILKAWLGGLELDHSLLESIYFQASYLSNSLEKHLLGNHYFVNLKALLFAGVIYEHQGWVDLAEKGLLAEIPEQVLDDGANFELTPMYHSLMLIDMLDMLNLARAYSTRAPKFLHSLLENYIPRMLRYMEVMAHSDGGVSFFNDSVDGVSPSKVKIEEYAQNLGFDTIPLDASRTQIIDNHNSGYICAISAGNKLIFDASPIGPDYIPGHGHADTLSFELSIGFQRVFVNSGISEYGLTAQRFNQRKTRVHNTVEIDGKDSSQVWSGFRVAKRASVLWRFAEVDQNHRVLLRAAHNGYKSIFSGCIHNRELEFTADGLVVIDSIFGSFREAKSRFYFHPKLNLSLEKGFLRIEGPKFNMLSDLRNKEASLIDSWWHPEFGLKIANKALELQFATSRLEVTFSWSRL